MNAVSIIKSIFPEFDWDEIKSEEYNQVLQKLLDAGTLNASAAQFMKQAKTRLGLHQQYRSGAGGHSCEILRLPRTENFSIRIPYV
jgi:hypothetical protein